MEEETEFTVSFGCLAIYGAMLALAGLGLGLYMMIAAATGDGPAAAAAAAGWEEPRLQTLAWGGGAGLLLLVVGAGLWRGQGWAWWLVFGLHTLAMLLLLMGVFAPLLATPLAWLGIRINPGLATPATALMGAAVNGAVLAYLWQGREEEQ
ncbi:MAG: hypothetical protein R3272_07670 [Candidatus Promineifilaceae bacterium]|nr:hypothetical protein [Candidatus Promineifilaceae bacterium]